MTFSKRLISTTVLIFTLLSGCASLPTNSSNLSERLDQWTATHQYDRALTELSSLQSDQIAPTEINKSIKTMQKRRQLYIESVLSDARSYESTLDWVNAEQVIVSGLKNAPSSSELATQKTVYSDKKAARIKMDKAAILIARAHYLNTARPHQESLVYNKGKSRFRFGQYHDFAREQKNTSEALYDLGLQYVQQKKYVQAREALKLSLETAENEQSEALLASIKKMEQKNLALTRKQQAERAESQLNDLTTMFYESIRYDDYFGAQKVLNEINALDITDTAPYIQSLTDYKNTKVKQLIESGNTEYNGGNIDQAIHHWQDALKLSPDNQVIVQQLEKAQTFIDNVERWQ